MSGILFHSHLGVGDQIACNGIVHWLARKYNKKVFVVCKQQNYPSIDFLYKDYDAITAVAIPTNPEVEQAEVRKLAAERGLELVQTNIPHNGMQHTEYWDQSFYDVLGLPYEIKYTYCKLPNIDEQPIIDKYLSGLMDYAFVHDDAERQLLYAYTTDLPIVKNQLALNVFEMAPILSRAKELHVMGSSLLCLADLMGLPSKKQKAYLYTFRGNPNFKGQERWIKRGS